MDAAAYGFVGTLVGAIVGASASVITTFIGAWNTVRLQQKANDLQRVERTRAFQRDTLIQLQDSLQDAMRNMGRMHYEDVLAFRKSGSWHKSKISEEVNQNFLSTNRDLSILTERIADDDLRNDVKIMRNKILEALSAGSEVESVLTLEQAAVFFNDVMEHIGKVLRGNY